MSLLSSFLSFLRILAVTFGFPMLPLFQVLLFLLLLLLLLFLFFFFFFATFFFFFPPLLRPFPSLESGQRTKSSEHAPRAFHLAIEAIVDSSAQSNLDFFSKVNYSAGLSRKGLWTELWVWIDESANLRALS